MEPPADKPLSGGRPCLVEGATRGGPGQHHSMPSYHNDASRRKHGIILILPETSEIRSIITPCLSETQRYGILRMWNMFYPPE